MKKILTMILFPIYIFASELLHTGEGIITIINPGSSWNVTFTATAEGARWDENYNLTSQYQSASVNIVNPIVTAYFDLIVDPIAGPHPIMALGVYKITAYENGNETSHFYMDWRTSDYGASPDVYFKYDKANHRFRNNDDTQTIDGTVQTVWDLKTGIDLVTSGLSSYWANSLVLIEKNDRNPRIVWGANPTMSGVTHFKIYRAITSYGAPAPKFFQYSLLQTVSASTLEFTDNDFLFNTGGNTAYWYIKAYNGSYSTASNIVNTGVLYYDRQQTQTIYELTISNGFSLEANYPNPFNPQTEISFSLPERSSVSLIVYDISGREITTILNDHIDKGLHSVSFDGSNLPSGIYIYRLLANGQESGKQFRDVRRMALIK